MIRVQAVQAATTSAAQYTTVGKVFILLSLGLILYGLAILTVRVKAYRRRPHLSEARLYEELAPQCRPPLDLAAPPAPPTPHRCS